MNLQLFSKYNSKHAEKIQGLYQSFPCMGEVAAYLDFSVHI